MADVVFPNNVLWPLVCLWLIHRAGRGFKGWAGAILTVRPVAYFGSISYGVYVYHLFMLTLIPSVSKKLGLDFWALPVLLRFVLLCTFTTGVSSLSWICFERPINGLKRLFPY